MAIAAPTTTSTPFAKLVKLGDTLVGAWAGSGVRQQQNYESQTPRFKADGSKLLEEINHFIAMPGTTAVTGNVDKGDLAPITPGDHVRYAVSGYKWGQVIDARKNLPAFAGFSAGQICSSDVYTFRLAGWSVATENPTGAQAAGFTVVDGRIVMRTEEELQNYVVARAKQGQPATVGKDIEITIRRIDQAAEKVWEQQADQLYITEPWKAAAESTADTPAPATPATNADGNAWAEEPF